MGPGFFGVFIVLFLVVFVYIVVNGITEWSRNNRMPVVKEEVYLVEKKRVDNSSMNANGMMTSDVDYYATFRFRDGSEMRFKIRRDMYNGIKEGEMGMLTHQGTRFHEYTTLEF
ncbi:MAG: DUF2500 domain-containing protein [Lachnospiraceae bacterium]|nr:DUF2500 domain-containing protein [Lachnospiraceae bacterium]